MALELKRVVIPTECLKCKVTGKIIAYGDFYYEDDVDGFVVDFNYYYDEKQRRKVEKAQAKIERALSQEEYKQRMKQAEQEFLTATLFDRPVKTDNLNVDNGIMPLFKGGK